MSFLLEPLGTPLGLDISWWTNMLCQSQSHYQCLVRWMEEEPLCWRCDYPNRTVGCNSPVVPTSKCKSDKEESSPYSAQIPIEL
jgi:hypothetical protein